MNKFQIKWIDRDGHTARTMIVRCKDAIEAAHKAPAFADQAIVVKPLSPPHTLPGKG